MAYIVHEPMQFNMIQSKATMNAPLQAWGMQPWNVFWKNGNNAPGSLLSSSVFSLIAFSQLPNTLKTSESL